MPWFIRYIKDVIFRWGPVGVVMAIIFWWSTQSDLPGATGGIVWWDFIMKKTAHLSEYACLFFLWQRALNWKKPQENHSYWLSFVLVCLYAMSDEIHQSFTPGRHPQLRDIGYDLLGGLLAYIKLIQAV
jgi:VanZ like family